MAKKEILHASIESELSELVAEEEMLKNKEEQRLKFISYANLFEQDLNDNLFKTSLELDDKYFTSDAKGWQRFLQIPCVKKYVDSFLDEASDKTASAVLTGSMKPNEALKVKERIEKKTVAEDNSKLIVVFLPQKDYV